MAKILGVRRKLRDDFDLIEMSDRGIARSALIKLAAYLDISPGQLARLLPISERTVQRQSDAKPFNRTVSEQVLQIASVAARGVEVFEDRDNFLSWLKQPCVALDNKVPLELLKSRFGADMVLGELGRMEHGVFS
jgi:putative toxin-antitoxin system antitoxin component (TIGR02293 family)